MESVLQALNYHFSLKLRTIGRTTSFKAILELNKKRFCTVHFANMPLYTDLKLMFRQTALVRLHHKSYFCEKNIFYISCMTHLMLPAK